MSPLSIGTQARRSLILYQSGARSRRRHIEVLGRLHTLYWSVQRFHDMMKRPNYAPQTSEQMRARADRLHSMKTRLQTTNQAIRPEYE